jgi:D-aminopeptidase
VEVRQVGDGAITDLFYAVIDATEEAILNALLAAETMVGRDGITAHAVTPARVTGALAD